MPKDETEDIFISYKFTKVTSYQNTSSVGLEGVQMQNINDDEITGQNLLIVEDMIDSGHSMQKIRETILAHNPESLKVVILLHKKNPNNQSTYSFKADYTGFWCPNSFVIGYGMDYNQYFRDIRHVGVISKDAITKFKK